MGLSVLNGSCKTAQARKSLCLQECMSLEMQTVESHSMGKDEKEEKGKGMRIGNKGKSGVAVLTSRSVLAPELAWHRHLFCLMCWAQQQRVLTKEMVPAPRSALLPGASWREGREQQWKWIPCPIYSQQGHCHCDQRARKGPWILNICTVST